MSIPGLSFGLLSQMSHDQDRFLVKNIGHMTGNRWHMALVEIRKASYTGKPTKRRYSFSSIPNMH